MTHVSIKDGAKMVVFETYSAEEMGRILREKIEQADLYLGLKLGIDEKLVKFVINKIEANKKGDVRILIEFIKILLFDIMKKTEEKTRDPN